MNRMSLRVWIGVALLAGSWLFGLGYFYPANPWAAAATVAVAVVLLGKPALRPSSAWDILAMLLLAPAAWFAASPYGIAPLLILLGLALRLVPVARRWTGWLASGAIAAGVILLVQSLALELYAAQTARSHDLPHPLPQALAGVARLLGVDASASGATIAMRTLRQTHRLAATWELLLDPATLLFFVGGLVAPCSVGRRWREWIRTTGALALVLLAWLPVRAGLLVAVYLHRVLVSDAAEPLHAMNHFFSPWALMAVLVVPVLMAWRFVPSSPTPEVRNPKSEIRNSPSLSRLLVSAGLIALAVGVWTAAIYWNPVGPRRGGRVMVVERHSRWEPTTKPYDTTWFAEPPLFGEASGYNYAAVYDYLGQYYEMSRLLDGDRIDDDTLARCDVLVIKIPTERYSREEAAAVVRFVERGGGLVLVGDHTNFSRSSTAMNDITRPMGFIFRDDLLFGLGREWDKEVFAPPLMPHPILSHMPAMDFAVSCSIDPGRSHGRAVLVNRGLWSMGPEYHAENFHPVPQHCPEMRCGEFIQVWAAWHGAGRAVAFTDSTIFSNFCAFQPGHAEILLGMVEWCNHANPRIDPRPWLLAVAPLLLVLVLITLRTMPNVLITLRVMRARTSSSHRHHAERDEYIGDGDARHAGLFLLAAGALGWAVAGMAVNAANGWAMPTPERVRPQPRVVIDRTISTVPLAEGMYPRGNDRGYGMFEAWIPRLGCHTVRKQGDEAFTGDALVVICPRRRPDPRWLERLVAYVRGGGKLLVVDTPENGYSPSNLLLEPFGLSFRDENAWAGQIRIAGQTSAVRVPNAWEVVGGQPVAAIEKGPVAASVQFGKGWVMAVGFGSLWNDLAMSGMEARAGRADARKASPEQEKDALWMRE
ncbi:MAG: hypothetical protein ABFC96_16420, partial [Thermoguttaceae bacterium]